METSACRWARSLATITLPGSSTRAFSALALFAAVQFADFALTLAGVARFGPDAESNPILSVSMVTLGTGTALSIAKLLAVALAFVLHTARLHTALALLTIFYVFVAVLPWMWLLWGVN
jgi:hypothetical protein